jgi:hypothetical protein
MLLYAPLHSARTSSPRIAPARRSSISPWWHAPSSVPSIRWALSLPENLQYRKNSQTTVRSVCWSVRLSFVCLSVCVLSLCLPIKCLSDFFWYLFWISPVFLCTCRSSCLSNVGKAWRWPLKDRLADIQIGWYSEQISVGTSTLYSLPTLSLFTLSI